MRLLRRYTTPHSAVTLHTMTNQRHTHGVQRGSQVRLRACPLSAASLGSALACGLSLGELVHHHLGAAERVQRRRRLPRLLVPRGRRLLRGDRLAQAVEVPARANTRS